MCQLITATTENPIAATIAMIININSNSGSDSPRNCIKLPRPAPDSTINEQIPVVSLIGQPNDG